jgi:hypothetical protein
MTRPSRSPGKVYSKSKESFPSAAAMVLEVVLQQSLSDQPRPLLTIDHGLLDTTQEGRFA